MRAPSPILRLALLLLPALMAGCAEELGPEPMRTTHVRGVVRQGRQPLARGWIEFQPFGSTVGNLRTAPIRPDGSFEATGVAVGRNLVSVVHASFEPSGESPRFRAQPFARRIPAGSPAELSIDLVEEALRRRRGLEPE